MKTDEKYATIKKKLINLGKKSRVCNGHNDNVFENINNSKEKKIKTEGNTNIFPLEEHIALNNNEEEKIMNNLICLDKNEKNNFSNVSLLSEKANNENFKNSNTLNACEKKQNKPANSHINLKDSLESILGEGSPQKHVDEKNKISKKTNKIEELKNFQNIQKKESKKKENPEKFETYNLILENNLHKLRYSDTKELIYHKSAKKSIESSKIENIKKKLIFKNINFKNKTVELFQ